MIVNEFLASDVFPLKKADSIRAAKVFFEDWEVFHLPVVDSGKIVGCVAYTDIVEEEEDNTVEAFVKPYLIALPDTNSHLFEVIKKMANSNYSAIPVINNQDETFLGIVTLKKIVSVIGTSALAQPGSIIGLEMAARDYSLAELARIIEYNDQKIISLFLTPAGKESNNILLSIKLNTTDIKTTLVSLERYGYTIRSVHQFNEVDSDMTSRFSWLLKYLNT